MVVDELGTSPIKPPTRLEPVTQPYAFESEIVLETYAWPNKPPTLEVPWTLPNAVEFKISA